MRLLYTFALHLYALFIEIASFFNKKARTTRMGQWRTNGILRDKIDRNAKYIWFHAASLGEFEQGRPIMEAIRKQYPHYKILLTFFSPSGYKVCKDYEGADVICYLPFDTLYKVHKFINLANPTMAIFIKYEFWYNYLAELNRRKIPTYLVCGIFRRSQFFFKGYGKWYRRALRCFDRLFVQDEASAQLLSECGITNVSVCGDSRFDRVLEIQRQACSLQLVELFVGDSEQLIMVVGSSWPQDEDIIIPYFNEHPEIKLIIAPHEINGKHLITIESKLKRPFIRMSDANEQTIDGKDCLIIDSYGLLSSIYRYGQIAYIGGGFGKEGVHNTLEAAVYEIPVLFGPIYYQFKEAKDLILVGGGFSFKNKNDLFAFIDKLIIDKDLRHNIGCVVSDYIQQNSGVTEKILKKLPLNH